MKINEHTTQEELAKVVDAGLRRDFLRSTPLNLKQFIPFSVLFLLFPGMVLGWRWGGMLTALFAAFLTGCLMWDADQLAVNAVRIWLFWGCATILLVTIQVVRGALRTMRVRRMPKLPLKGPVRGTRCPKQTVLPWKKESVAGVECYVSRFVLDAPKGGFYAFLRVVDDFDGVLHYSPHTCFEHMEGKTGLRVQDVVIYYLEAGCHELIWSTNKATGEPPKAFMTQLNRVH